MVQKQRLLESVEDYRLDNRRYYRCVDFNQDYRFYCKVCF